MKHTLTALALLLTLSACGTSRAPAPPAAGVKLGKPYSVGGTTYTPEYTPQYDETGTASWYGPGFHGRSTASGEIFDQDDLTAAHPTLPMPCLVRVTNLDNGRSEVIRVNDRGPFKDGRLIDLSRGAARTLGITGLAKVRVQYLKKETEAYWAKANLPTGAVQLAEAEAPSPQNADTTMIAEPEAVPPPVSSPQVRQAAPVMSVTINDLTTLSPVSDAQATEREDAPFLKPQAPEQPVPVELSARDDSAAAAPPQHMLSLPTRGGWYIQAGAFSQAENATRLAERLNALGPTDVSDLPAAGHVLHRVRVGPFASRASAQEALARTQAMGVADAKLVQP